MPPQVVIISFQPPFCQREGVAHPKMSFGHAKPSTQGSSAFSKNHEGTLYEVDRICACYEILYLWMEIPYY
jgi:hypothetical protein